MSEYDAFGRKVGEDTLRDLGWSGGSVEAPGTAAQPAPPPLLPGSRRRSRGPLAAIVVVLALAGLGVFVVSAGQRLADEIDVTVPELPSIATPSAGAPEIPVASDEQEPEEAGQSETPSRSGSLLKSSNLSRAIDKLRGRGRIVHLRLASDRIDAQLLSSKGRLRSIQLRSNLEIAHQIEVGGGFSHLDTIAFGSIDPGSPTRLISDVRRHLGHKPAVNYLVVSDFSGEIRWNLYLHDGKIFQGNEGGRLVRRVS